MIQEVATNISHPSLADADTTLRMAIDAGYRTAVWRHPNQTRVSAIIDVTSTELRNVEELESSTAGFVVNPFHLHHPSVPGLLSADIMYSWDRGDSDRPSGTISPQVSSSEVEAFLANAASKQTTPVTKEHPTSPQAFEEVVEQAIEQIKSGSFSKVVLSRTKELTLPEDFDVLRFFEKACDAYSNAFCYVVYTPEYGLWMGATPETLLSMDENNQFETMSLAGTQRLEGRSLHEIAWTQKEIEEQAMVSRYIIDCFKKIRLREFEEKGPQTAKAGNLAHLKSTYAVDMKEVGMEKLGSTMMHLLHPTSAVCGMPLMDALAFIKTHEQYDRELYAGFLGPVNMEDTTRLYVNLRCMKILNASSALLYAGAGITADSDPHKEFIETEMKINTLKKLFDA